ncbi:fibronectin type III domain-containing protein [Phytohabitans sp. ZYX-F-186]|uniref:Fibronectin type III domain-containing protein n=1 Tax=Phytohabitans maris TaxID=3071409 RepID=A0ABU0ZSJ7_9ACTN|nr:fibronectin type III domain-containing protein [Phytohabitans sp. ZYX-F-186]MDQ7908917.1 fibronectin type III domain-containing protein [Phytohabitans sp. ZYX-F-186]
MARSSSRMSRRAAALVAVLSQFVALSYVVDRGSAAVAAPPDAVGSGRLVAIAPRLVADAVAIPANGTVTVDVDEDGVVPAGAAGVAVTVSARSDAGGTLAVYPSATTAPPAVAFGLDPGRWARGAGIVGLDDQGRVNLTNRTATVATVSVEASGYVTSAPDPGASTLTPIGPVPVAAGLVVPAGAAAAVTPAASALPTSGVRALALTVSATGSAAGQVTVHPTGSPARMPQLELAEGQPVTSHALVPPGPDGSVTVTNSSAAPVTVDLHASGFYAAAQPAAPGLAVVPITPARVRDVLSVNAFGTVDVAVAGAGGVPADAAGICLTVHPEPTTTTAASRLTVYATGASRPAGISATSLRGLRASTSGYVKLGTNGGIRIYNPSSNARRLAIDATCYLRDPRPLPPPADVTATGGDGFAAISWTPPASDVPLSQYTVTASPGDKVVTAPGNAAGAIVDGLTNGTAYTFTVVAHSGTRQSPPSAPSSPTTPGPPPTLGAPFVTYLLPRDAAVRVTWAAPPDGADSVTSYRIRATPGGREVTVPGTVTETVVTGLSNGTAYRFTVTAGNANGAGAASFPSEYATPRPADAPLPPAGLLTVALDRRIDVQWVAPADGGAPISGYTVSAEPGGHRVAVAADTTVAKIEGLTNGTAYTVRVTAANSAGTGEAAEATAVRPSAARAPDAPVDLRATAVAAGTVELAWAPPVDVGTGAITSYRVTASPGGTTVTATGTTARITGLDPETGYLFTVAATNPAGTGPAATTTRPIRPALQIRTAPRILSAAELAAFAAVEGDTTLVFANPPASLTALRNGTILAVAPHEHSPRGLLRTVTSVSRDGSLLRIATRQTPLTDVFDEADLTTTIDLGDADIAGLVATSPAVRRRQPTIKGKTLDQGAKAAGAGVDIGIRDGNFIVEIGMSDNYQAEDPLGNADRSPPVGGRIEAQLDLDPEVKNSISISLRDGVKTDHLNLVIMKTELRGKFGFMMARQLEKAGLKLKVPCQTIPVGPVPVVICPELDLSPRLDVDGSIGITGAVGFGRILGSQMSTHNGTVTNAAGINDPNGPARHNLDIYGDANLTFSLATEFTIYFYSTAGPGLVVRPYLQLKVDTTQNPWWELRLGITLGVFLQSREFFGRKFEFRRDDLVNFFLTLAQADGPFHGLMIDPEQPTLQPDQPQRFTAHATGWPGGEPVTWRVVSGPGTITPDGTFVSPISGTAVIEAVSDTGPFGEMRGRTPIIITGTTVPSTPREPTATAAPFAADVSWQPPQTDGRSPIVYYAVVTLPDGPTTYVPGNQTSTRIGGLTPFTPYQFTVHAINVIGISAASPATPPVTPNGALRPDGDVFNVAVDAGGSPDNTRTAGGLGVAVSGDGRYVVFGASVCSNLAPPEVHSGCASGGNVLLRKDLVTGEIKLASRRLDGHTPATVTGVDAFDVNYDGNKVVFVREPDTLTEPAELLVHDLDTATTTSLGARAELAPHTHAVPVRMIRNGLAAIYVLGYGFGEQMYLTTGPGEPQRLPCPSTESAMYFCSYFDVDEAGATVVLSSTDTVAYKLDIASGALTILNPETDDIVRERTSLHDLVISRDGTTMAADWRYDPAFGSPDHPDGLARTPVGANVIHPSDVVLLAKGGRRTRPIQISADARTILYVDEQIYSSDPTDHLRVLDADQGQSYDVAAGLTPDGAELTAAEMADNATLIVMPYSHEQQGAVLAQRLT